MKFFRWYDRNPNLKQIFEFIRNLDEMHQSTVAQDIIQILLSDFNLDLDKKINEITKSYNYKCKRWYDKNIELYTSFEIIKGLSPEEQDKAIEKIYETVLFIYLQEG